MKFIFGGDPYKKIKIGQWHKPFKVGDQIKVKEKIFFDKIGFTHKCTNDFRFDKNDILIYKLDDYSNSFIFSAATPSKGLIYFIHPNWVLKNTKSFERL